MKLIKLGMASILAAGALYAGSYTVDPSHSNVKFKVKHLMISNVSGSFNQFEGKFEYDEKTNTLKSLSGKVDVSSINTDNEKRDKHLKSSDFFAVEKYPTITFDLTEVKGDKAYGKFTMRGVTKDVAFDLETAGATITDPWGNIRTGLTITGEINRKDYGVNWNKALEAGGVVVSENVKIMIDLEGIQSN